MLQRVLDEHLEWYLGAHSPPTPAASLGIPGAGH
jgi:hypothetical protein